MTSIAMLSAVFTRPVPPQQGQSSYTLRLRLGRMRCRVISIRPNGLMRRIFVRARSRLHGVAQRALDAAAMPLLPHVDEVVDDHAAQVAQPELPGDLLGRASGSPGRRISSASSSARKLPLLTSIATSASVWSMTSEPPPRSGTCRWWIRAISSSSLYLWNSGSLAVVELQPVGVPRHHDLQELLGPLEGLRLVDLDRVDVAGEDVADRADDHVAFFVDVAPAPASS